MHLGENIKRLRQERNWSQSDLAAAMEEPLQAVSRWESGAAVPELDRLIHLSLIFEVSLEELAGKKYSMDEKEDPQVEAEKLRKDRLLLILKFLLVGIVIFFGIIVNMVWFRFLLRLI